MLMKFDTVTHDYTVRNMLSKGMLRINFDRGQGQAIKVNKVKVAKMVVNGRTIMKLGLVAIGCPLIKYYWPKK